jgi:hypothetical protein
MKDRSGARESYLEWRERVAVADANNKGREPQKETHIMYIKRTTLLAVTPAVSRDETRYTLNGIYVEPGGTFTATDGHRLHQVKEAPVGVDDYPSCGGIEDTPTPGSTSRWPALAQPFIMPRESAVKLEKSLPKGKALAKRLPMLEGRALLDTAFTNGNGKARWVSTDLETVNPIECSKIDGSYPDYKQVIPNHPGAIGSPVGVPSLEIGFNAEYLLEACRAAIAFSPERKSHAVKLAFWDALKPATLKATNDDGDELTCVVMPMRF